MINAKHRRELAGLSKEAKYVPEEVGSLPVTVRQLESELKTLRRGYGVLGDHVASRTGPGLRAVCGISDQDDNLACREKLTERISLALKSAPDDVRLAAVVALGMHPLAQDRYLERRLKWFGENQNVGDRTVKRRVDEAFRELAERLMRVTAPRSAGWYVKQFTALLMLDSSPVEALERRSIVATTDGLRELETSISVPRHRDDESPHHSLDVDVLQGGTIVAREQPYESLFRQSLLLPKALEAGDNHEYLLRCRLPAGQRMAPHYVHVPYQRCDKFELRVRFDRLRLPSVIWKLTRVTTAVIYELLPTSDILIPDGVGEVHVEFENLDIGYGYGICWKELGD